MCVFGLVEIFQEQMDASLSSIGEGMYATWHVLHINGM